MTEREGFLIGESKIDEVEDFYENEYGPTVSLKDPIDIAKLRSEEGVEFEIDDEIYRPQDEFNKEEMLKHCSTDALGINKDDSDEDEEENANSSPFEELAKTMQPLTEDGGVKKKILKPGTGGDIPEGAKVTVHYNAYCEYSDEPCDSTYLRSRPYSFNLSVGGVFDVILGLDSAVRSMKKGEVSKFLISPSYGYGKLGVPPRIPTNATLLFQVELVTFSDCGGHQDYWNIPWSERKECSFSVALKAAVREKECGKEFFQQTRYHQAVRRYTQSLKILENARLADQKDEEKQRRLLLKIYLNIAVCCIKLGQPNKVISMCNQAQQIDRNHAKVFYLRGKALRQQGDFERSRENLLKAKNIKPADRDIAKELMELEKRAKMMKIVEQERCRRMFKEYNANNSVLDNQSQGAVITEMKDEHLESDTQQITTQFKEIVEQRLQLFMQDDGLLELPFKKSESFTNAELACVTAMAEKMNLGVIERGEGNNFHIKVQKKNVHPEAQ